jgi:hypothetical protein
MSPEDSAKRAYYRAAKILIAPDTEEDECP